MKPEIIKAIFTNLLFVIGVILTIVGFTKGALTITRIAVFDIYPLDSYEETRCSVDLYPKMLPTEETQVTPEKTKYDETWKADCTEALDRQREIKKFDDIVNSVSFFVAGIALTYTFKRFILK